MKKRYKIKLYRKAEIHCYLNLRDAIFEYIINKKKDENKI
jgi:hypothetical protein